MEYQLYFLYSDVFLLSVIGAVLAYLFWKRNSYQQRKVFKNIFAGQLTTASLIMISFFTFIAVLDSIHFEVKGGENQAQAVVSLLDLALNDARLSDEKTYSQPFALSGYVKEMIQNIDGTISRDYPLLNYTKPEIKTKSDVFFHVILVLVNSAIISLIIMLSIYLLTRLAQYIRYKQVGKFGSIYEPSPFHFKSIFLLVFVFVFMYELSIHYHILGTDKVGKDIFYICVKSIRTGITIGLLTTMVMVPIAIIFGVPAGYFGGRWDDVVQYIYTTLSSIPGVLLIAASVLSVNVYLSNHPEWVGHMIDRSDLRLVVLCLILGVTGWTHLCRLLRAEAMKLRTVDFVQAARSQGVSHARIIFRHILPNTSHVLLITVVLDFSMLILAEAVLSYVGVGVDPSTYSWGNMINSARLELAREPVVWWPIFSAFTLMFLLVISFNLVADSIRSTLDPRS